VAPIHGNYGPSSDSPKRDDIRETGDLHEKVWELERRLEKEAVTIEALFALFSPTGVASEALTVEVHRVEQDRAHAAQKTCTKCGHVLGRRQLACVYCGQARVVDSPFELL
jgi:hypothetical protein